MRQPKSRRKFATILKSDPRICIIQSPSGAGRVTSYNFAQLMKLGAFVKTANRVAKLLPNFCLTWDESGFHLYRVDLGPAGPSIFTNAELIERHAIYDTRGKNLTADERQREGAKAYGMQIHFGRVE